VSGVYLNDTSDGELVIGIEVHIRLVLDSEACLQPFDAANLTYLVHHLEYGPA
jgi:hypothetical protein